MVRLPRLWAPPFPKPQVRPWWPYFPRPRRIFLFLLPGAEMRLLCVNSKVSTSCLKSSSPRRLDSRRLLSKILPDLPSKPLFWIHQTWALMPMPATPWRLSFPFSAGSVCTTPKDAAAGVPMKPLPLLEKAEKAPRRMADAPRCRRRPARAANPATAKVAAAPHASALEELEARTWVRPLASGGLMARGRAAWAAAPRAGGQGA
mmetsp:Transcript_105833/g.326498  ORF Transcript_105833/g.326498 Transcript_105833/m.326498 type:complete len:204 (+) Transcript_105833:499-1110(+)